MLLMCKLNIIKPHLFVCLSINTFMVVVFNINTQVDILDLVDHDLFNVILGTYVKKVLKFEKMTPKES